jgi:FkbM family methyltransferase
MTPRKIIYDIGSNNGDDLPYYLKKCDRVIAVEANPALCEIIKKRFISEIRSRQLVVENVVLTTDASPSGEVHFFLHRTNHVLSQFPVPEKPVDFERVLLPCLTLADLIQRHGVPHYVKIDLEHYDAEILRALLSYGIFPQYISTELHGVEPFCLLAGSGRYHAFKLVDGHSVSRKYHHHRIAVGSTFEKYSFPNHSAGPYGEDLPGDWMTPEDFLKVIAFKGPGHWDIHASLFDPSDPKNSRKELNSQILTIFSEKARYYLTRYWFLKWLTLYRQLFNSLDSTR